MIYLITGVPGAGKTLRAVELIDGFLKEGRPVYSNIDGLSLDGIKPAPNDWRETPHGSVVVYDEAQQIFGADGRSGRSSSDVIQAMETHRHTGHDIVLVTQHHGLIHSHVRRLVGRHEHVQRVFGSKRVIISWKDRAFDADSRAEKKSAVTTHWSHPSRLFPYYKSASLHIDKARIPGRVKFLLSFMVIMAVLVGVLGYRFYHTRSQTDLITHGAHSDSTASSSSSSSPESAADDHVKPTPWPVEPVVAGCIWTSTRCQCYTRAGWPIRDEIGACFRRVTEPLMRVVRVSDDNRTSPPRERERSEPHAAGSSSVNRMADVSHNVRLRDPVALSAYVDPVALSDPSSASPPSAGAMPQSDVSSPHAGAPTTVEQAQPFVSAWRGSLAASVPGASASSSVHSP